jgi:hypothetical protein
VITPDHIDKAFSRMGARVKIHEPTRSTVPVRIDVRRDRKGEFFDIGTQSVSTLRVIDVAPAARHLLLVAGEGAEKWKFLCGHDERAWFVAAVPESARGVTGVTAAREALKPAPVLEAQGRKGLSQKARGRRRNKAFVRQGEWFFIPQPDVVADEKAIFHNEPIRRGRGKPHWCQDLHRRGGTVVYVRHDYPNGVTEKAYQRFSKERQRGARRMVRDAEVFVRGTVRHSDHKTIKLVGWHRVLMNTEHEAAAMQHVAFLD